MDTLNDAGMKLRACIYLRVSTDEQAKEGYGLEVQEDKCRKFCESQGYTLSDKHVVKDDISGGLPVQKRPGLSKLFEWAKNEEFDVLVVYKTDRLARNLRVLVNAIHELEQIDIVFRSVTEPFDTSTPFGQANLNLFGTFAQFEKEMIRERTMSGRMVAMKKGKWLGTAPYGYSKDKRTGELIINDKEAEVVKKLFRWLVNEKLPLAELARRANNLKIVTPYTTRIKKRQTFNHWFKRTVGRIMTNEVYTGTFHYRKYKRPFNNLTSVTEQSRLRPKEDWITISVPPIITTEMFEAAKRQLLHNREYAKRNRKREYMYAKIIYCSECGFKMFGGYQPSRESKHIGTRYYHGVYRKSDSVGLSKRCEWCPQYSEPRLEPIWDCLKKMLQNPQNVLGPLERYIHKEKDPKVTRRKIDDLETMLKSIQEKQAKVQELYIEGGIDKLQLQDYSRKYQKEEADIKTESTTLRQSILTTHEKKNRAEAVQKAYQVVKTRLESPTYEEQTKIVGFFIQRITLHAKEDYAEVVFRFPSNIDMKLEETVSHDKTFPLVLNIPTISEHERRAYLLKNNPHMYVPKKLI